ncbi:MAG: hypothetical protein ACR2KG_00700 [Nocardioidaceae bacterium]
MAGRHVAPRHKAPRSRKRTVGRFAGVAKIVPGGATGVVAVVGAAGMAVGVSVVATGSGVVKQAAVRASSSTSGRPHPHLRAEALASRLAARHHEVSRSTSRPALADVQGAAKPKTNALATRQAAAGAVIETVRPRKATSTSQAASGSAGQTVVPVDPHALARSLVASYGWSSGEYYCLDAMWVRESAWDPSAQNPASGAYGIPQALPGDKMAAYGGDWRTNAATQIKWGLAYIKSSYGTPCGAWSFWQAHNYY